MDTKDEEFLKRLQATFRVEAEEHIRDLTSGLIEFEKAPKTVNAAELVEKIYREAHSLKGAARSVNMKGVESLCQELESIFGKLKNEQLSLTGGQYDLIYKALDSILKMVSTDGTKIPKDNSALIKQLQSIAKVTQTSKTPDNGTTTVELHFEETKKDFSAPNEISIETEFALTSETTPNTVAPREIGTIFFCFKTEIVFLFASSLASPIESARISPFSSKKVKS